MKDINKYESVVILKKDYEENVKKEIIEKVKNITLNCEVEELGVKKLAYEVKGYKEGDYMIFNFEQKTEMISKLEKYYKENETILKFIIVRED